MATFRTAITASIREWQQIVGKCRSSPTLPDETRASSSTRCREAGVAALPRAARAGVARRAGAGVGDVSPPVARAARRAARAAQGISLQRPAGLGADRRPHDRASADARRRCAASVATCSSSSARSTRCAASACSPGSWRRARSASRCSSGSSCSWLPVLQRRRRARVHAARASPRSGSALATPGPTGAAARALPRNPESIGVSPWKSSFARRSRTSASRATS